MNRYLAEERLAALARQAVPALADFCLLYVLDGANLRCAAAAHVTRTGDRLLRALKRVYRITRDDPDSTVAQVVRQRRHSLRDAITAEDETGALRRPRRARIFDLHRQLAVRAALVVPIEGAQGILGAIAFSYSTSGRRYTAADVPVAERIARQVARTLDNAPLLDELALEERRLTRMLRLRARAL
jgi:GAF domain-containing protein